MGRWYDERAGKDGGVYGMEGMAVVERRGMVSGGMCAVADFFGQDL